MNIDFSDFFEQFEGLEAERSGQDLRRSTDAVFFWIWASSWHLDQPPVDLVWVGR